MCTQTSSFFKSVIEAGGLVKKSLNASVLNIYLSLKPIILNVLVHLNADPHGDYPDFPNGNLVIECGHVSFSCSQTEAEFIHVMCVCVCVIKHSSLVCLCSVPQMKLVPKIAASWCTA